MARRLALGIVIEIYVAGCARRTTPPETTPVVATQNEVTSTVCGETEGGMIGNWVECVSMDREGRVEPSRLDVGSPYAQTSELTCGAEVVIWNRTFEVTCGPAASRAGYPPETAIGLRDGHQSFELIRVPQAFLAVRWWASSMNAQRKSISRFAFSTLNDTV